jgi:nitroreductase
LSNTTLETIHAHRSIRKYKPDPVADELLDEILAAGIRTSSSGNMQTYSIIVTRDQALRERLAEPHFHQNMVLNAPVLMTFCADFHRMRRWLQISHAPDNFDNFMSFMVAAIDAVLVSQNVTLAAESRGLGICYLGSTLANAAAIGRILELPKHVVPVVGFSLGWPAEDPAPRDRLPMEGLVHNETYHDYSDEQIQQIHHDRESKGWSRYMEIPKLRKMVEDASVENLAQLYTTVKYTRESHEEFSRSLLSYLREQGFLNQDEEIS